MTMGTERVAHRTGRRVVDAFRIGTGTTPTISIQNEDKVESRLTRRNVSVGTLFLVGLGLITIGFVMGLHVCAVYPYNAPRGSGSSGSSGTLTKSINTDAGKDVTVLNKAKQLMNSIGLGKFILPELDELLSRERVVLGDSNSSPSPSLNHVLVFGLERKFVIEHFPIVLRRPTDVAAAMNSSLVSAYLEAVHYIVSYYDIKMIIDTDHTRGPLANALLSSKQLEETGVKFVLCHLFPIPDAQRSHGFYINHKQFKRIDYILDYSSLFNIQKKLIPPEFADKMLVRPYANMGLDVFESQANGTASSISEEVSTIIEEAGKKVGYILACGSNRRDYSGVALAAERAGIRMVIAESHPDILNRYNSSRTVRAMTVSFQEFNALLANAIFALVPTDPKSKTPVGIGTMAKIRMAKKVAIITNNTGMDTMITHGYDGFFMNYTSAEQEEKYKGYETLFRKLIDDEPYRNYIEQNIDPTVYTDKGAGQKWARIVKCLASPRRPLWVLHHIADCRQCERDWCGTWTVNSPNVGVSGRYSSVGPELSDLSCNHLDDAVIVHVVRNSDTGKVYAAVACPEGSIAESVKSNT